MKNTFFISCRLLQLINRCLCKSVPQLSLDLSPFPFPVCVCVSVSVCVWLLECQCCHQRIRQNEGSGRGWISGTHESMHTHTCTRCSSYAFISRPGNAHWLQHISTGITKVTSRSQGYGQSRLWKCRQWVWPKSIWLVATYLSQKSKINQWTQLC